MQIGGIKFKFKVFLAPIAGVTDRAYRIIAHDMGCELVYSEMVSAKAINFRNDKTLNMLETIPEERPIAIQLFGSNPDDVSKAGEYVTKLGVADIIDFNMGCPAPKVVKNGDGSALMCNPDKAERVLSALVKSTDLPVTVKIRSGWDREHVNAVDIAVRAERAGVAAVTVHGRTREQFYRDHADWNIIRDVKDAVSVPVIANGDVRTEKDLSELLRVTGADGVMIGRAAQGNPWIFREMKSFLMSGKIMPKPSVEERCNIIMEHLDMLLTYKGSYIGPREMRKHATWYTRGIYHGAKLREKFNKAESREDFVSILKWMLENIRQ